MKITHAFVSPKGDGPDSTLVRPSNWNALHPMVTDAGGVVLGVPLGSPAGPVEEIAIGGLYQSIIRVEAGSNWVYGTTGLIGIPFDTNTIDTSGGVWASPVWHPPPNSTWKIDVQVAFSPTNLTSTPVAQVALYDWANTLLGSTVVENANVDFFVSDVRGGDIYHFGASPPNVGFQLLIAGGPTINCQFYAHYSHYTAQRVG